MLLLVGLGNPGPGYAKNRHNVGFMAVDEIVRRHGLGAFRRRFRSDLAEGGLGGEKLLAQKPLDYMNRSGLPVAEAAGYYKLDPGQVVVIHDDLDLAVGKVRVKTGGGHGGHNGLRDIDRHLGQDYRRIRIGIGHPGDKDRVHGYVLTDFAKSEWPTIERIIDAVAAEFPLIAAGDDAAFMSRVAMAVNPPKSKAAPQDKPAGPPTQRAAEPSGPAGGMKAALDSALAKLGRKSETRNDDT